jgi:antitoxin component YwqK of YwqJK toxin-antitoxin module
LQGLFTFGGDNLKKILFSLICMMLITTTTNSLSSKASEAIGYTYSDQKTNVKMDSEDYSKIVTSGYHMVWIEVRGYYEQIFYSNMKTGEVIQITDTKSRKREPVVTETNQGTFIIWADNLNFYGPGKPNEGRDIFSYHLETKLLTQLNQTSGPDFRSPSAYKNHVTWTTYDNTKALYDYDLNSKKESIIGYGVNPIAGSNKIIFTTVEGSLVYYDLKSNEQKAIKFGLDLDKYGDRYSSTAFNGNYLFGIERIGNTEQYLLFDANHLEDPATSLNGDLTTQQRKVLIGDTYGVWVENLEGKVELTGVDLLYKDTFKLPVQTSFDKILAFVGDQLVYIDEEDHLVYRTIKPPLNRSIRTSNPIYVVIDGQEITFHAPPVLIKGTTMVEFRPIFEKLGFSIEWNDQTKTITGKKGSTKIELTINKNEALLNGKPIKLDQSPSINYNYTYIPLRFIGEAANRNVTWKQEIQTAMISPKDSSDTLYYENGSIKYKGDLVDGKRQGKGTSYFENGRTYYIGEWKNDTMEGKGQWYYSFTDAMFFEGTFVDGKQSEGTEYYPGGVVRYKGNYKGWLQNDGVETLIYSETGEVLIAEVKEGSTTGKATLYFSDGTVEFEGTFKDGAQSEGKLYDKAGKLIYEGEFEHGEPKKQ